MNHSVMLPMALTTVMVNTNFIEMSTETQEKSLLMQNVRNISSNNDNYAMNPALLESFTKNRRIEDPWYHILILMYSVLIIFGAVGNSLVVAAVIRNPVMRTARNMFILNLAISDLLLCLITMPLTLMELQSKFWPFGNCALLCKLIATLQALSIYVSTNSIIAIAFDRYQVIVYPTSDNLQFVGSCIILVCIWLLAILLASPLFIYKRLIQADIPQVLHSVGIPDVAFCIEDWPVEHGRFYYSMFSLCVQYMVPILVVTLAYYGIYNKLKSRISVVSMNSTTQRKAERGRRFKRTNCLLVSIAVIFGISWLPLNSFNLYADVRRSAVTENMLVIYAICHMIGMSSACSNPLLYGWLNDNFRKEFQEILCRCTKNNINNNALHGQSIGKGQSVRQRANSENSRGDFKPLASGNAGVDGVVCGRNTKDVNDHHEDSQINFNHIKVADIIDMNINGPQKGIDFINNNKSYTCSKNHKSIGLIENPLTSDTMITVA